MAVTPSTMLALGTTLPDFSLPDYDGRLVSASDLTGAGGILIAFVSAHCPFVKLIQQEFGRFAAEYEPRGVRIVAVASNDLATYPEDGPASMRTQASESGWSFPYLVDADQQFAKACHAACTPDWFLFDRERRLVYRGQFDDARPGSSASPTGKDLRMAVDQLLAGEPIPPAQTPSIGCNIKWKPGGEPVYVG